MKRSARLAAKESAENRKNTLRNRKMYKQSVKEKAEINAPLVIKHNNESGGLRRMSHPNLNFAEKNLLWKKAPRLFDEEYINKLNTLNTLSSSWIRELRYWRPKGKSKETIYRSLCDHLLAKYSMPNFLWSGLEQRETAELVARIASGGSIYEEVKSGRLSVPLTRKMCHDLMTKTKSDMDFYDAIRYVQVKSVGGTEALFNIWRQRFNRFNTYRESEVFWMSVLDWFAKHPMLAQDQISPLCDYIGHRYANGGIVMKGREPLPLIREMQEWHGDLARSKVLKLSKAEKYSRVAFDDMIWEKNKAEIWTCEQILTPMALADEGKTLSHCVYSYHSLIVQNYVSIWSLCLNDMRKVTIEVNNRERKIVQVRGKHNRRADHDEMKAIIKWAGENRLILSSWL